MYELFFLIALSHISLRMYYEYTFSLIHNFKWSLSDFENMLPWERDIYIAKLEKQLDEEKRELDKQEQQNR